jgi:hypothetical protein
MRKEITTVEDPGQTTELSFQAADPSKGGADVTQLTPLLHRATLRSPTGVRVPSPADIRLFVSGAGTRPRSSTAGRTATPVFLTRRP